MLGRLDHDEPGRVEAGPARAAGDLEELAGLQDPLPVAVELREPGEEHRADRHVDADAEGVGAADDGEQAGLGEGLHEAPVLGQHPGVVHADAGLHQLLQRLAEARAEPEGPDLLGDGVLVLPVDPGESPDAQQPGRVLDGVGLREVHDVRRRLAGRDELLDRLVEMFDGPPEAEGDGPLGLVDHGGRPAGTPGQVGGDLRDVAQGRGHQHELRVGQLQERHLPRPAAVRLAVVVELVHHHQPDVGAGALAQGDVGEHLGGAGDDRRVGVDAGVAGQHADVVGAEHLAEREELLAHQRLDRRGVERHPPVGQRRQVSAGRDQRLPRPRRRRQHHVAAAQQLDQRLVLVRVERQPLLPRPLGQGEVQGVGVALVRDDEAGHGHGHCTIQPQSRSLVEEGALAPVDETR